jgi:hypothetical protein
VAASVAVELATAEATELQVQTGAATATRDLESLCALWPAVVDLVRGENALLGALIAEAQPVEIDGEDLTVAFAASKPFLRKKASVPLNRAAVTEALRAVTGLRCGSRSSSATRSARVRSRAPSPHARRRSG